MKFLYKPNTQYSLKAKIQNLLTEAELMALEGKPIENKLAEVESLNKILSMKAPQNDNAWLLVGCLGSACVLAVTVAAFWKTSNTRVQLDVQVMAVSFRPATDVNWDAGWPVNASNIRFENIETASFPDFPKLATVGHLHFDVMAESGKAKLALISLARNSHVYIDHSGHDALLSVSEKASSVQLLVGGSVRVEGKDDVGMLWSFPVTSFDDAPTEIVASGPGKGVIPASMRIKADETLRLGNLDVNGLAFSVESSDQQGVYKTSILGGSITLSDIGETVPLLPNGTLRMFGVNGKVSLLEISPASISVRYEGKVSGISVGSGLFEQDLTPSVLNYLLHQKQIALLWGALTGLWGLVWSASKLVKVGR